MKNTNRLPAPLPGSAPSPEELKVLADLGYTVPRVADRYGRSTKFVRNLIKLWPNIEEQIMANGRKRTVHQSLFGNYQASSY